MNLGDLSTFGADVLPKDTANSGSQFVLTRLHVRYTKESLGEDITFRSAPPIVGGREMRGLDGKIEHGALPSSYNNFQARYAIRHGWAGPIACKEPHRGVWGGKPGTPSSPYDKPVPKSAQKLGLTPHVKTDLASFVKSDIPEIGFTKGAGGEGTTTTTTPTVELKRGCLGCAVTQKESHGSGGWLVGLGVAILAIRRRKTES
jgi:hypothetical protein